MKVQKFAAIAKKTRWAEWINVKDSVFLAVGTAIYKADGLPRVEDEKTAAAVLDIEEKKRRKMNLKVYECQAVWDIHGFNMADESTLEEQDAKILNIAPAIKGEYYKVAMCDDGEILFFDETLLYPLADVFKDELSIISYSVRKNERTSYVIVRNGFLTLAAIMPVKVLSDDYISELQGFQLLCIDQLNREKLAELEEERRKAGEDGMQSELDIAEEET